MFLAIKIAISFLLSAIGAVFAFFSSALSSVSDPTYQGEQAGVGTQLNSSGEQLSILVGLITFVIILSAGIYLSILTSCKKAEAEQDI